MATTTGPGPRSAAQHPFRAWLLEGLTDRTKRRLGPHAEPGPEHRRHSWWKVMCLTGPERLLSFWKGKLFVLTLLGFAATDFLITITLSAADATAHVVENPHVPTALHGHEVAITLVLIALLGAVFLKGVQ